MDFQEKEAILIRIQSGVVGFSFDSQRFICKEPSALVKFHSNILYNDMLKEIDRDSLPSLDDIQLILTQKNMWSHDLENELQICTTNIDQLKVAIYNSRFKSLDRKEARKALKITRRRFNELTAQKHIFDYLSYEHICNLYKQYYLFYYSLCDFRGQFLHNDYDEQDFAIQNIDSLLNKYYKELLVESQFRELARTDPWSTIWVCADKEHKLFGVSPTDYNIEQRMLIAWSTHYNNIYQRSDAPPQSVVDDDDALDGWFITIKRQKEVEDNAKSFEDVLGNPKLAEAGEIYIPAQTPEDAAMIHNLNDSTAKMIKSQRANILQKLGTVDEMQMPDTKQKLFQEMNQKFASSVKG